MRKTLASILSTGASPWKFLLLAATLLFSYAIPAHADDHEEAAPVEEAVAEEAAYKDYDEFVASDGFDIFTVNNLWILIAAFLVFTMHLGFATLESGLCQKKNTVNILFKNVSVFNQSSTSCCQGSNREKSTRPFNIHDFDYRFELIKEEII